MRNTDWVEAYIENTLSNDSKINPDVEMTKKLEYANLLLYKYCYVCEEANRSIDIIDYHIENFKNDEIYFQNPANLNDPFDCFLGFSQSQMVRDIINAELKRQKKLTASMKKTIDELFSNDFFNALPIEKTMNKKDCKSLLNSLISLMVENGEQEVDFFKIIIETIIESDKCNAALFCKLVKDTLTIKDKQFIIDKLFENEKFTNYLVLHAKCENNDSKLKSLCNDMKIKIETYPKSFLWDDNIFTDYFQLLITNFQNRKMNTREFDKIRKMAISATNEIMSKTRNMISEKCKVTCFSEIMNSPLMWSHYANKHYGFCLEYDFTHTITKQYPDLTLAQYMLFPVIYSQNRPLISKSLFDEKTIHKYLSTKEIEPKTLKDIVFGLLYKSDDWLYEKEWRIIKIIDEKSSMKLPSARKIFLGANMEENAKNKVIEIAKSKNIPVYQMILSLDKYKFDYLKIY